MFLIRRKIHEVTKVGNEKTFIVLSKMHIHLCEFSEIVIINKNNEQTKSIFNPCQYAYQLNIAT